MRRCRRHAFIEIDRDNYGEQTLWCVICEYCRDCKRCHKEYEA